MAGKSAVFECIAKRIEEIISGSIFPEDPVHSKDTLKWLLVMKPDADEALQIAALGHDIERGYETDRVLKENYELYNEYKATHALNSAKILKEELEECGADEKLTEDVYWLVSRHEWGGDERADLLREADTISFFHNNLSYYFRRHTHDESLSKCRWCFDRLSVEGKAIVRKFDYQDEKLFRMFRDELLKSKDKW